MRDLSIAAILTASFVLLSVGTQSSMSTEQLKGEIEKTAVRYFVDNAHPVTGQVRDKANNFTGHHDNSSVASIAATGFGLAVIGNAGSRGLVEAPYARDYILKTLRFVRDHVPRRKGWFLHFYDWETGERRFNSEYSTIDTALFIGGALYARALYPNTEIAEIVTQLYRDLDYWEMMTDGGARPEKRTISMAYVDEYGFTPAQWHMYAEQMLLLITGLGHPSKPLPAEVWLAFERDVVPAPSGEAVMGLEEALFVHQYSQAFIDFRHFPDQGRNHFINGLRVSRYHRDMREGNPKYKSLREGFWGYSAGESPKGYEVWNALNYDGVVCIGCAVASVMYMPKEVMQDLGLWRNGPYKRKIWGKYGFADSLDLDRNWFAQHVLGITVGPAYMSLANTGEETSYWRVFNEIPEIRTGLERAAKAAPNVADARAPTSKAVSY